MQRTYQAIARTRFGCQRQNLQAVAAPQSCATRITRSTPIRSSKAAKSSQSFLVEYFVTSPGLLFTAPVSMLRGQDPISQTHGSTIAKGVNHNDPPTLTSPWTDLVTPAIPIGWSYQPFIRCWDLILRNSPEIRKSMNKQQSRSSLRIIRSRFLVNKMVGISRRESLSAMVEALRVLWIHHDSVETIQAR